MPFQVSFITSNIVIFDVIIKHLFSSIYFSLKFPFSSVASSSFSVSQLMSIIKEITLRKYTSITCIWASVK